MIQNKTWSPMFNLNIIIKWFKTKLEVQFLTYFSNLKTAQPSGNCWLKDFQISISGLLHFCVYYL